jgi:glycosyltransferase involved in cell wall biosynthesis
MNKRVLCFTPWFPDLPGGREGNYIFDSVMAVSESSVDMKVLLARHLYPWKRSSPEFTAFPANLDLKLVRYPGIPRDYFRSLSNKLLALSLTQPLLRYAEKHGVQLIHVHTEALAEVAAIVAEKLNIPCVVTLHGINTSHRYLGTSRQKSYFRDVLNRVNRVILVGESLRDYFAGITGRDEHFRIVHNCFNMPCKSRTDGVLTGAILRLISVSNLHEGKGIDLTIRALAKLKSAGLKQWRYQIVGDGYLRAELEQLVRTLDLADQIVFVGAVPHAEVVNFLMEADLFVLPSYREAFGVAYLEAMACGLLAIGVQEQGPSAFILHGETGFLTAPKNVDDLSKVLAMVMHAPLNMRGIAEAGRIDVISKFSSQNHAGHLNHVYDELLAEIR